MRTIFAENTRQWYELTTENGSKQLVVSFDDYPNRHWWEKGVYYDYELIVQPQAIAVAFWDIRGKVMGCTDCSMAKQWYVATITDTEKDFSLLSQDLSDEDHNKMQKFIHHVFRDIEPVLPHKVHLELAEKFKAEFEIDPLAPTFDQNITKI